MDLLLRMVAMTVVTDLCLQFVLCISLKDPYDSLELNPLLLHDAGGKWEKLFIAGTCRVQLSKLAHMQVKSK